MHTPLEDIEVSCLYRFLLELSLVGLEQLGFTIAHTERGFICFVSPSKNSNTTALSGYSCVSVLHLEIEKNVPSPNQCHHHHCHNLNKRYIEKH